MAAGAWFWMISSSSRCNVISRAPSPLAVLVAITPWATWQSREPETSITPQPAGQTIFAGQTLSLSVTATGVGLTYQWRLNSNPLSGASLLSYTVGSAQSSDVGPYTVVVSNAVSSVTSVVANLFILSD